MIPHGGDWKFVVEGILFAIFLWPLISAQIAKFTGGARKTVTTNH